MSRLITDADVREGRVENPLVIDERTTITPAALDRACHLGIRVVYARGGEAAPAAAAESADVPVLHLPDGHYHVVVDRGRARVYRLTRNGPIPLE